MGTENIAVAAAKVDAMLGRLNNEPAKWTLMDNFTAQLCASEGCHQMGVAAAWRFECGGVGSHFCDQCRSKIEGKHAERVELVSRLRLGGPNAAEVSGQAADDESGIDDNETYRAAMAASETTT